MGPFSAVLELLIFKIFWPLRPNRDTKLSLNPPRGPFNVKMLPPPLSTEELSFMKLKGDRKFGEESTCRLKIDIRNLANFDLSSRKSQRFSL